MMRRPLSSFAPAALITLALAATGCQQLFTTSLAAWAERDSISIPKDISNADAAEILATTDDPTVLSSLLAVLNDQAAAGDLGSAALAAETAVGASGVADGIMPVLADYIASGTTPDVAALVTTLQAGATTEVLAGLDFLGNPAVLADAPLTPTELLVAASILAASALPAGVDPTTLDGSSTPTLTDYQNDLAVQLAFDLIQKASADLAATGADTSTLDAFAEYLNTGA